MRLPAACRNALAFSALITAASAQDASFLYSGTLSAAGQASNGIFDFRFALADTPAGNGWLGPAKTNVAVGITNGSFSLQLDYSGWTFDNPRWLEVSVRSNSSTAPFTVLTPRQVITPVPRAVFATTSEQARTASFLSGGGMNLTAVPATSLVGAIPLRSLTGITSNQVDAATDAAYRASGLRGIVTPYECGAKGDGVSDDTGALQEWINRACTSNLIAFLPPAPGRFYKITDSLYASNTISILGAGGAKHSTGQLTSCMIKQFAPGKHGLVLLSANDSVRIDSIAIVGEPESNWQTQSYGIWFAGGASDADCSLVQQCLVMNFGIGVMAASQADTAFRNCSFGYNGIGIRTSGIANNIILDSCQLSYNRHNQVFLAANSTVTIQNSDIAAGADGSRSAQGVFCNGQELLMLGNRFEDYTTNAPLVCTDRSKVTLIGTHFYDFSRSVRYSIIMTNSHLTSINSALECLGPTGVPVLDVGVGKSGVTAIPPVQQYLSIGRTGYVNTATVFVSGRPGWTGTGPGPHGIGAPGWAFPGSIDWGSESNGDQSLWAYGRMAEAGYPGVQAVDLLAFAKQQRAGLHGNGLNLTNLHGTNILSGTIRPEQLHPEVAAAYRNQNAITNNYTAPVTLGAGLTLLGNLQVVGGSLVVQTNAGPGGTTPKAWFEVRTSDGQVWKVGLHQ